jgi:hypothetical protein
VEGLKKEIANMSNEQITQEIQHATFGVHEVLIIKQPPTSLRAARRSRSRLSAAFTQKEISKWLENLKRREPHYLRISAAIILRRAYTHASPSARCR